MEKQPTPTSSNAQVADTSNNSQAPVNQQEKEPFAGQQSIQMPSISLPQGGGAIQSIGEKFQVSAVTGTGNMSVPIAISPGRGGVTPQLALSYDSGAGNGFFGAGWSVGLPSISRKTQKGLPLYQDNIESDTFILAGAEDLVPILGEDEQILKDTTTHPNFNITKYKPRTEGLFARIERWENRTTKIAHWRVTTKDNITTVYGQSSNCCIIHPDHPTRIFQWFIERSFDDKGNILFYQYKKENAANIPNTIEESNRQSYTQLYPKRIFYGNTLPYKSGGIS